MPNDSQPAPGKTAEWTARTWTSRDGLKLYYRDYPGSDDRPPLLCLHGLTRNSRDFEDFAERYAGRFRVIAVDFRGRGMSERDPQPARYLPTTYAADILHLLDEPALNSAAFTGPRCFAEKPMRFRDWGEAADYVATINLNLPASNSQNDWIRAARRVCR